MICVQSFNKTGIHGNIMSGLLVHEDKEPTPENLATIRNIQSAAYWDIEHQIESNNATGQITSEIIEDYADLCINAAGKSGQAHMIIS